MIPIPKLTRNNEPPTFNKNCRQPGALWLAEYTDKDPHEESDWWSQFQPDLAKHFEYRCGWLGICIELDGVVDHYLSCGNRNGGSSPHRHLAFDWTNYRYASGVVNSRKGTLDSEVMDPCEVQEGWFEVLLPSFELVATDRIPAEHQYKAQTTIKKLHLGRALARFTRWRWYQRYWNGGNPNLEGLRHDAPLVAAAIEKAKAAGQPLPDPTAHEPDLAIQQRKNRWAPRVRK